MYPFLRSYVFSRKRLRKKRVSITKFLGVEFSRKIHLHRRNGDKVSFLRNGIIIEKLFKLIVFQGNTLGLTYIYEQIHTKIQEFQEKIGNKNFLKL